MLPVVGAFFKRVCSGHTAAPATPCAGKQDFVIGTKAAFFKLAYPC